MFERLDWVGVIVVVGRVAGRRGGRGRKGVGVDCVSMGGVCLGEAGGGRGRGGEGN